MATAKHTPGPWALYPIAGKAGRNKLALHAVGRRICDISVYDDEDSANASLIAEAGTVYHETGLTPRQLAEQRAELLAALRAISRNAALDDAWLDPVLAAIAKAEGGAA